MIDAPRLSPPEIREMLKAEGLTAGRVAFFDRILTARLCKAGLLAAGVDQHRPEGGAPRPGFVITAAGREAMDSLPADLARPS